MNKVLIKKRFAKNLNNYNNNAKIQNIMAEKLIALSQRKDYENILEIGCGTGFLTQKAVESFVFKNYIANDIVGECESYIRNLSEKIDFIEGDIEELIENISTHFDLIFSNATFQWIENPEKFINSLMNILKPNGMLLFSTFGAKNFNEIYRICGESLEYKSADEYKKILGNTNFHIEEEIIELEFESPKEVLSHIKNTGVNAIKSKSWTKSNLLSFEKDYNSLCNNCPKLTYNPIYILINK